MMSRILITGEIQSGKSTLAGALAEELQGAGYAVAGFLAPGSWRDGVRWGFDLKDLRTGAVIPLARRGGDRQERQLTPFHFDPDGLARGREILRGELRGGARFIFVDEVGKLELSGGGWAPCLESLMAIPTATQIWIVRRELLERVTVRWPAQRDRVVLVTESAPLDRLRTLCLEPDGE